MRTRVKICCMASPSEVRAAAVAGADCIGAVGPMPSGPGPLDDETARAVIAAAPPGVTPFLLSQETGIEGLVRHARATRATVVQLVRHVDPRLHFDIREALPGVKIVQVIHVENETALELARGYALTADALLLDSGNPATHSVSGGGDGEELGGTGRTHDWALSRRIVSLVEKPVYLAGGLIQANVADAIAAVRPFGVDLCSGVRTLGKLDTKKLTSFFAAPRGAERSV
jgi:phosphoribosylanthranilate isomerase